MTYRKKANKLCINTAMSVAHVPRCKEGAKSTHILIKAQRRDGEVTTEDPRQLNRNQQH